MKQTNNAIKFLMAQYRAIFQNAYFKGLATAAVVTMGLAAGQAQATKTDAVLEVGDSVTVTPKTITINGTASRLIASSAAPVLTVKEPLPDKVRGVFPALIE